MISPWKIFLWKVFFLVLVAEAGLLYWVKEEAPGGLMSWVETHDASPYYGASAPDPPYDLSMDTRQFLAGRVAEAHVLSTVTGEFGRIAALRNWTRVSCGNTSNFPHTNNPVEILRAYDNGSGGACGSMATLYCATLITHGFRVRLVQLIRDRNDVPRWLHGPVDTHVTVEVYSDEIGKWYVSDPTFNCWFHRGDTNTPLSARELQEIAVNPDVNFSSTGWIPLSRAGVVVAEYDGASTLPRVESYYIDPALLFINVFLLYYDVYGKPPEEPVQKYSSILQARFLGTEKIVWLLPPGDETSYILILQGMVNWIPLGLIFILILIMVPGSKQTAEAEEEEDQEEEEEEEEE